jgi:hypothetical protein
MTADTLESVGSNGIGTGLVRIAIASVKLGLCCIFLLPAACGGDEGAGAGGGPALPVDAALQGDAPAGAAWFEDVAAEVGLDFVHDSGYRDRYLMPEMTTGGGGFLDIEGDGDLDIYLVQAGHIPDPEAEREPNRMYRNLGDGRFEDVTEASGTGDRGFGEGLATGDYDNDGDVDLYVTNVGPNVLYRNDGKGHFEDVSEAAGVAHPGWGTSAAFFDYDRDGYLDLFLANYLVWSVETEVECQNDLMAVDYCSPIVYNAPALSTLYRNLGDGRFEDVSAAAGISLRGTGLGVVTGDFNADGLPDVFVANDGMTNRLWINQGDGRFVDEALIFGVAMDTGGEPKAGMGTAAEDVDHDGDLDLIVCNLENETDSFFANENGDYFKDRSVQSGLATSGSKGFTRFGVGWADFDNDGWLDLFQANGRVVARGDNKRYTDDPYAEPNLLLRGLPDGSYVEVEPRGGTEELISLTGRGAAFGDVDGDGRVDVLVVNRDGPVNLLRNRVANSGHWIALRILDEHGRDALGASVKAEVGQRIFTRELRTTYSYQSANTPWLHWGLGDIDQLSSVSVRWPDGAVEDFGGMPADAFVTLRRGEGDSR